MKQMWRTMVSALIAVTLNGCGTFCNFGASVVHMDDDKLERPAIYGGIQLDLALARALANKGGNSPNGNKGSLFIGLFDLADMPLSLIADTLTLPITVLAQEIRVAGRGKETPETSQADPGTIEPLQP